MQIIVNSLHTRNKLAAVHILYYGGLMFFFWMFYRQTIIKAVLWFRNNHKSRQVLPSSADNTYLVPNLTIDFLEFFRK